MSTELSQSHICRLLLTSLCALMLLLGWFGTAGADPLRRIDQIKAAMAAPKAADASTFAGQAPARSGLLHRPSSRAFPPGPPLAMPSWSTAFVRDGISYPLTVMGTDPALGQTTTIPTVIFAYRLQLADGSVFDASRDVIDGVTPVQGVLASPIFTPAPWTIGGVSLGITQWSDAMMRANFWSRMSTGYHVLLGTPTVIPITVDVPAASGFSFVDPKSGVLEAAIDGDWLFNLNVQVTNTHGVPPTTMPIHLFSQVITAAYGHEIFAGFHDYTAFTTSSGATVAAPFIETAYFSKAREIANGRLQGENTGVLAHEIAEWLMDPTLSNFTTPWQNPAEPGVCNNPTVEVGDPLEYIAPGLEIGGYRFPDVALLPWYTGSQVLQSVNHQYSLFGTLTSPSSVCPNYSNFGQATLGIVGADATVLTGINNQHQVVGYFTVGNGLVSFILSNVDPIAGTAITGSPVSFPGSLVTYAQGLNDAGNVVGIYLDSQQQVHGFLLQGIAYTSIDFPGAVATEALGTNKHGDIVGDYTDTAGTVHGFVLTNGRFLEVDAPFASGLSISAINDSRIVVGTYSSGSTIASFSGPLGHLQPFSFPQLSPLDVVEYPATFTTYANGLNNSQEIAGGIGGVASNGLPVAAYVANAGLFEPVAPGTEFFDGAQTSQVTGVNDAGVVSGSFTDRTGTYGVLLVPGTAFGFPYQRIMIAAP
jgi:hypothetical protein